MTKRRRGRGGSLTSNFVAPRDPYRWPDVFSTPRRPGGAFSFPLLEVEDRRAFYPGHLPLDWLPARLLQGRPARFSVAPGPVHRRVSRATFPSLLSPRIAFEAPARTVICVRRQRRKEVLHALGIAGGKGFRRPHRSVYSEISCRSKR